MSVKVALNMIIKNESKILPRFLKMITPWVDAAIISDTGSTDNSLEILEEFKSSVPRLHVTNDVWKNFGHNRSLGIEHAKQLISSWIQPGEQWYILFLDADMLLRIDDEMDIEEFKKLLPQHRVWYLKQINGTLHYLNVRIVEYNVDFSCVCPTHEYYDIRDKEADNNKGTIPDWVWIDDRGDGGSKEDKFHRDVKLLTEALEEKPMEARYWFYLANSFNALGEYEKCITSFEKRIRLGGWFDELYVAHLYLGDVFMKIDKPEEAVITWLNGHNIYPQRAECIYRICKHYRTIGKNSTAWIFYQIGHVLQPPNCPLFQEISIHNYLWDFELCVLAYYQGKDYFAKGKEACEKLISMKSKVPADVFSCAEGNLKFYL